MDNNLIIIEQLPIIKENLHKIKADVESKINEITSLACTNETVKLIKERRAVLNKEFIDWESKRKEVKKAIIAPYEDFEKNYKECISDIYKTADISLKAKINDIESTIKQEKQEQVKLFFDELKISENVEFLSFEDIGLNVTLSVSLKKLKEQVENFIEKIKSDMALIKTMDHKEELFVEYKKTFDITKAISTVTERRRLIDEDKKREEKQDKTNNEEIQEETIKPLNKPVEEEKQYTLQFKVTATKSELIKLKDFLNKGGYKYE